MFHTYNDVTIIYDVIRKNRQSVGIYLDSSGHLQVVAPKNLSDAAVVAVLEEKWESILKTQQEVRALASGPPPRAFSSGEFFHYLGHSYPIKIMVVAGQKRDCVELEENKLLITVADEDPARVRQALRRFYYQRCKALVEERIRHYQDYFKVRPRGICINDNPAVWGTCNGQRQLTFNWKLAMAPTEVIDYIVVHELCHMTHLNHDRSFWRLVGKLLPDYKARQDWLQQSGWKMEL
jgi:hypothetical protein